MLRRRLRPFVALIAVALLATALAACSDSGSSTSKSGSNAADPKPKVYTQKDFDITVLLEHQFIVELPATPSTGYAWTAVTNDKLQQETTEQIQGGSQPGAEGTQRITFRAQGVGTVLLVLNYARSFEPGVPPAKTQLYKVTVKNG
jgi:predicted secreted protein